MATPEATSQQQAQGTQQTQAPEERAPWITFFPKDVRGEDMYAWGKTVADVANFVRNTVKERDELKAKSGLKIPGADAKPEELAAFRQALGVPETPDGYKVTAPEGMPAEEVKAFLEAAHKAGYTPAQVNEVIAFYQGSIKRALENYNKRNETRLKAAEEEQRTRLAGGDQKKYDGLREKARRTAALIGGDKLMDKVGNDPELVEAFIKLSSVFGEDGSPIGSLTGGTQRPGQVDEKVLKAAYPNSPHMFRPRG